MRPRATETENTLNPGGRSYRAAVAAIFFLMGAAYGSWVSRIPAIQQNTGVSTGMLSLALVTGSITSMAAMALTGALVERHGSRRVTRIAVLLLCFALPLPGLAEGAAVLVLALVAFNVGFGIMEVAVNSQALRVEQHMGRRIMSSLHGLFSIGGMAGSAAGGWAAARGVGALAHLVAAAATLALVGTLAGARLLADRPAPDAGEVVVKSGFQWPHRAVLGLAFVALCALVLEGAMGDWSALYLTHTLNTGPGLAALGFSAFSLCMAGGRLMGDLLAHRTGPAAVVRGGALAAGVGLVLALVSGSAAVAIAGFALVGIGAATIVPLVYSAAGETPGVAPSRALASVATLGSFGFLIGPPVIGFVAEAATLRAALTLLIPLCLLMAAFAGKLDIAR
jgi:MFS family permease